MSRQRKKGTAFETALVRWLRERLGDGRIERRALHGSRDIGDVYGLVCHGNAEGEGQHGHAGYVCAELHGVDLSSID